MIWRNYAHSELMVKLMDQLSCFRYVRNTYVFVLLCLIIKSTDVCLLAFFSSLLACLLQRKLNFTSKTFNIENTLLPFSGFIYCFCFLAKNLKSFNIICLFPFANHFSKTPLEKFFSWVFPSSSRVRSAVKGDLLVSSLSFPYRISQARVCLRRRAGFGGVVDLPSPTRSGGK